MLVNYSRVSRQQMYIIPRGNLLSQAFKKCFKRKYHEEILIQEEKKANQK